MSWGCTDYVRAPIAFEVPMLEKVKDLSWFPGVVVTVVVAQSVGLEWWVRGNVGTAVGH